MVAIALALPEDEAASSSKLTTRQAALDHLHRTLDWNSSNPEAAAAAALAASAEADGVSADGDVEGSVDGEGRPTKKDIAAAKDKAAALEAVRDARRFFTLLAESMLAPAHMRRVEEQRAGLGVCKALIDSDYVDDDESGSAENDLCSDAMFAWLEQVLLTHRRDVSAFARAVKLLEVVSETVFARDADAAAGGYHSELVPFRLDADVVDVLSSAALSQAARITRDIKVAAVKSLGYVAKSALIHQRQGPV